MNQDKEEKLQAVFSLICFGIFGTVCWFVWPYLPAIEATGSKVKDTAVEVIHHHASAVGQGQTQQEQFDDLRRQNHESADRITEIWTK